MGLFAGRIQDFKSYFRKLKFKLDNKLKILGFRLYSRLAVRPFLNELDDMGIKFRKNMDVKDYLTGLEDFSARIASLTEGEIEVPQIERMEEGGKLPGDITKYRIKFGDEEYKLQKSKGDIEGMIDILKFFNREAEKRGLEKRFHRLEWLDEVRIAYLSEDKAENFLEKYSELPVNARVPKMD